MIHHDSADAAHAAQAILAALLEKLRAKGLLSEQDLADLVNNAAAKVSGHPRDEDIQGIIGEMM